MSLICAHCKRLMVMSENNDHYGICSLCPRDIVTKEEMNLVYQ